MNAEKQLLNDINPVKSQEKVKDVLNLMKEFKFSHLPVIEEDKRYLGLLCEDDLLEAENEDKPLIHYLRFFRAYAASINSNLFEVIKIIGQANLSLLPIVDQEGIYRGYLSPLKVIRSLACQLTFSETGGVLILELAIRDFQLSQISQIIESEDAKIMGVHLMQVEKDKFHLNLKINQKGSKPHSKTFERYNYKVVKVFHENLFDDTLGNRYQFLLKYLNV